MASRETLRNLIYHISDLTCSLVSNGIRGITPTLLIVNDVQISALGGWAKEVS